MKPRIRLDHGVWCCYLPDWPRTRRVGMGFSPADAFEDWRRLSVAPMFHGKHING